MSDRVRAKFFVQSLTEHAGAPEGTGTVNLSAVSRGAENADWARATPSGELRMTVNNPGGYEWFRLRKGQEVYLTLEDVDASIYDPTNHAFIEHPHKAAVDAGDYTGDFYTSRCAQCGKTEEEHTQAVG